MFDKLNHEITSLIRLTSFQILRRFHWYLAINVQKELMTSSAGKISPENLNSKQGCTNSESHVSRATKFCTVGPNSCRSSSMGPAYVILLAPRILKWRLDFYKICAPLILINAAVRTWNLVSYPKYPSTKTTSGLIFDTRIQYLPVAFLPQEIGVMLSALQFFMSFATKAGVQQINYASARITAHFELEFSYLLHRLFLKQTKEW